MASNDTPFAHSRDSTLIDPSGITLSRTPSETNTMSGPFMYANELGDPETVSDAVLSFYLDTEDDEPHPSELRVPYTPLLRYLRHSGLVREFRRRVADVVRLVVEIGGYLFPPACLLNEVARARILEATAYINEYLDAVVSYLKRRVRKTHEAFCRLPSPSVVSKEELALSISKWSEILESLHNPTGREASLFREVSTIYSSHVYQPFLQLHRTEPDHNMWQLEPQLTPIALSLREAATLADRADCSVRAIQEEFEVTMSCHSNSPDDNTVADNDTGVLGESRRHHTPSKSAPAVVAGNSKTILCRRERENTL